MGAHLSAVDGRLAGYPFKTRKPPQGGFLLHVIDNSLSNTIGPCKLLEMLFMDFAIPRLSPPASGKDYHYVVLQVDFGRKNFVGTGSGYLTELEEAINHQAQRVIARTRLLHRTAAARV